MAASEATIRSVGPVTVPRWITITTATVLAILIPAVVWLAHYQPIGQGNYSGFRGDRFGQDRSAFWAEPNRARILGPVEGETFFVSFSIMNDGPLPVTIKSIQKEWFATDFAFEPTGVRIHPTGGAHQDQPYSAYVDFTAFRLGANEQRNVIIDFAFNRTGCSRGTQERSWISFVPIEMSVAPLITKTVDFPLPQIIATDGGPDYDCIPTR